MFDNEDTEDNEITSFKINYRERKEVAPFMAGIGGGWTGGVTLLLDDARL